jgi:hypothetical protein
MNEFCFAPDNYLDSLLRALDITPEKIGKDVILVGVTEIGEGAFEGCTELFEINIPDTVTKIGDRAFYGCDKLVEVIIPESVTEIGDCVFPKTTRLLVFPQREVLMYRSICDFDTAEIVQNNWRLIQYYSANTYQPGVMAILKEDELFSYGDAPLWEWTDSFREAHSESFYQRLDFVRCLKNLKMYFESPDYTVIGGVLFNKDVKTLIFCSKWKTGKYIVPDSVIKINDEAFKNCEQLSEIECQKC